MHIFALFILQCIHSLDHLPFSAVCAWSDRLPSSGSPDGRGWPLPSSDDWAATAACCARWSPSFCVNTVAPGVSIARPQTLTGNRGTLFNTMVNFCRHLHEYGLSECHCMTDMPRCISGNNHNLIFKRLSAVRGSAATFQKIQLVHNGVLSSLPFEDNNHLKMNSLWVISWSHYIIQADQMSFTSTCWRVHPR